MGVLKKGRLHCRTIDFSRPTITGGDTWVVKHMNNTPTEGIYGYSAYNIWTDGTNIYYSYGQAHYVLNGDTWETKALKGLATLYGDHIWTDGTNIYYSRNEEEQYVLNGDTWEPKTWHGLTDVEGKDIWTDGTNIYYSNDDKHYVLNGDTWEHKTWHGLTDVKGKDIWTDGTNIYYSAFFANILDIFRENRVLNGDTWVEKTWNEQPYSLNGSSIWTDGTNIYYSGSSNHYVLNGDTWVKKTWGGSTVFLGSSIWTDGTNIYHTDTPDVHYVLTTSEPPEPIDPQSFMAGWHVGQLIAAMKGDLNELVTCLTFTSEQPFSISVNNSEKNWNGALYYSTDTRRWSEWNGTTTIPSRISGDKHKVYMRGINNTVITGDTNDNNWVLNNTNGANIYCSGNIETLLDWRTVAKGKHPSMDLACFRSLFSLCDSLVSAPDLPAI